MTEVNENELHHTSGCTGHRLLPVLRQGAVRGVPAPGRWHSLLRGTRAGGCGGLFTLHRADASSHAHPGCGRFSRTRFLLGLIPGVGAIYNGQYVKGLIHVVVLGILIGIVSSGETADNLQPLFGMMIAVWVFYMAFEAYHTAKKRQLGQPVDEFSSIVPRRGEPSRFPLAPVVLIAAGLLFLLNNLDIIRFGQLLRYWPIALIALGVYLLYERLAISERGDGQRSGGVREATNERH